MHIFAAENGTSYENPSTGSGQDENENQDDN